MARDPEHPFVGRGGIKLRYALDVFGVDVAGLRCADLGCSTGGFTDCLLQAGAERVYAVDTGYGVLAWKLRKDPRVTVIERANALHVEPPEVVDLVTIDLGWTPQRLCIPAAVKWLGGRAGGRIITLIKPHYEAAKLPGEPEHGGVLAEADAERIRDVVLAEMPGLGVRVEGVTRSPILGSKGKAEGNVEYLALVVGGFFTTEHTESTEKDRGQGIGRRSTQMDTDQKER